MLRAISFCYTNAQRNLSNKALGRRVDLYKMLGEIKKNKKDEEEAQIRILWNIHYALVPLLRDVGEEPKLLRRKKDVDQEERD